jgi:hypothetical protein
MMTLGIPSAPAGAEIDLSQTMAVGRNRAQGELLSGSRSVQIDAVKIVARLLGRYRKLGLVDQPFEIRRGKHKLVRHVASGEVGEVAVGQRLQGEARATGADRHRGPVAGGLEHNLRAFRKLAHDFIEHVRRHGGHAARADLRRNRLDHLEIEIGGLERKLRAIGAHQDIGENRDRVAPLNYAMHMRERSEKIGAFDSHLHAKLATFDWNRAVPVVRPKTDVSHLNWKVVSPAQ